MMRRDLLDCELRIGAMRYRLIAYPKSRTRIVSKVLYGACPPLRPPLFVMVLDIAGMGMCLSFTERMIFGCGRANFLPHTSAM
jgi:hypothetical protein